MTAQATDIRSAKETLKAVVISTAHMTEADSEYLLAHPAKVGANHAYGHYMSLSKSECMYRNKAEGDHLYGLSDMLVKNLKTLRKQGFELAVFDTDGRVYDELESSEW